jgi:hypothetical protein
MTSADTLAQWGDAIDAIETALALLVEHRGCMREEERLTEMDQIAGQLMALRHKVDLAYVEQVRAEAREEART